MLYIFMLLKFQNTKDMVGSKCATECQSKAKNLSVRHTCLIMSACFLMCLNIHDVQVC